MSKYILERETVIRKLSSYITEDNKKYIDYLISVLGDIELSEDDAKVFLIQFIRVAGPYDVLTMPSTINSMYNIRKTHPKLSSEAINTLFPRYIEDLFKAEDLENQLDKFIKIFGYNDAMFEIYLDYIDKKADTLQNKYIENAKIFDELRIDYSKEFVRYLKSLAIRKHYDPKDIMENIPTKEFIKNDETYLRELMSKYRIVYGATRPISYDLVEKSLLGEDMSSDEELYYAISIGNETVKQDAGFKLSDFNKNKRLELKKGN